MNKSLNTLKLLRGLVMSGQKDPATMTKMVSCFHTLERELAEEKQSTSVDTTKILTLEAQIEALEGENTALGLTLDALKSELQGTKDELTQVKKDLTSARRKLTKLEKASEDDAE